MNPVKVIICGAKGRMGRALVACVQADPELKLVGEIDLGDAQIVLRIDARATHAKARAKAQRIGI